jgi:hypothetical protein
MSQDSDNAKCNTIVLLRDAFHIGLVFYYAILRFAWSLFCGMQRFMFLLCHIMFGIAIQLWHVVIHVYNMLY